MAPCALLTPYHHHNNYHTTVFSFSPITTPTTPTTTTTTSQFSPITTTPTTTTTTTTSLLFVSYNHTPYRHHNNYHITRFLSHITTPTITTTTTTTSQFSPITTPTTPRCTGFLLLPFLFKVLSHKWCYTNHTFIMLTTCISKLHQSYLC